MFAWRVSLATEIDQATTTSALELFNIADGIAIPAKFRGAVLAPNGLVALAPYSVDGVGLFDATTKTFEFASISGQITIDKKLGRAAVAPNGLVVFSPLDADGVGLFDASTKTFCSREFDAAAEITTLRLSDEVISALSASAGFFESSGCGRLPVGETVVSGTAWRRGASSSL